MHMHACTSYDVNAMRRYIYSDITSLSHLLIIFMSFDDLSCVFVETSQDAECFGLSSNVSTLHHLAQVLDVRRERERGDHDYKNIYSICQLMTA